MDDDIRPPDKIIRECLLPNNYFESEEEQIRCVLEESESDFELQIAILESTRIEKERHERASHFASFRIKIAQFMRIDVFNQSFYSDIINYLDKYESGEINTVIVDDNFYMKFRKTLSNMRIREEDKTRLLEFIKQ